MPDSEHTANYLSAADVLATWRDDVLTGKPRVLYPVGSGELTRIEIGPKLVTLIGGAAGAGKSAFVMQCVVDALRLTSSLESAGTKPPCGWCCPATRTTAPPARPKRTLRTGPGSAVEPWCEPSSDWKSGDCCGSSTAAG